jgi:hypothetical protein
MHVVVDKLRWMTWRQQFTAMLVSVKGVILLTFEGTNDGVSKGEHSGETDGEYTSMDAWAHHKISQTIIWDY